ncbi:MAG: hypothetical protein DPW18_11850 [Chloroflexi bacterium]|nr:hypothetical protein [Chloroflexota bacterium]MDL1941064.1 hypothetical protein [Chloroflexi bacterium CFX2]
MNILQIAGLLVIIGALVYSIGDVLLPAGKLNLDDFPRLKPFREQISDAERMAVFSSHSGAFVHGTFFYMGEYMKNFTLEITE